MGKEWDKLATGRSAKYRKGGEFTQVSGDGSWAEAHGRKSRKGFDGYGQTPNYVNRPAKRCANCDRQAWSGSPCQCDEPRWIMDNSPLETMQSWHESWAREAYRVLKPGGHLLAFGGSRTYHRMACAIEDAGFEIRDQLQWLQGSGFPKSLNVSKAIQANAYQVFRTDVLRLTSTTADFLCHCSDSCRQCGGSLHWSVVSDQGNEQQRADAPRYTRLSVPSSASHQGSGHRCTASFYGLSDHLSTLGYPHHTDADAWQVVLASASFLCLACFFESMLVASDYGVRPDGIDWSSIDASSVVIVWATSETLLRSWNMWSEPYSQYITALTQFAGFGTALKPSHEPIVLARKPLIGTVAANVAAHGTGAMNIDGCRIETTDSLGGGDQNGKTKIKVEGWDRPWMHDEARKAAHGERVNANVAHAESLGRWPANVIVDEDAAALLDAQSGERKSGGGNKNVRNHDDSGWHDVATGEQLATNREGEASALRRYTDRGGTNFAPLPGPRGGSPLGRWPANVVLGHSPDCREVGVKRVKGTNKPGPAGFPNKSTTLSFNGNPQPHTYADPDGYETVTAWECAPDCAVALLDAQSGERKSGGGNKNVRNHDDNRVFGAGLGNGNGEGVGGDTGGASRFFLVVQPDSSTYTIEETEGQLCGDEPTTDENTSAGKRTASNTESSPIGGPGKRQTDQYRQGRKSTTETETPSTTTSPIWNALPLSGTTTITNATEKTTSSLTASSIDDASDAANTELLTNSSDARQAPIRGTAWSARAPISENGDTETANTTTPTTASIELAGNRFFYTPKASRAERNAGLDGMPERIATVGNFEAAGRDSENAANYYGGERARVERGESPSIPRANHHPTVKPIALMRWLCRLVTPPGGTVLDPFLGSGTTGIAAALEGFDFVGIEQDADYLAIAEHRIAHWTKEPSLGPLFELAAD